jgi:hypothetical protein
MVVFTYAFLRRYFKPAVVQGTEGSEEAGSELSTKMMRPDSAPADFPKALNINSSKKESPLLHARSELSLNIHELTDDDVPEGMPVKFRNTGPESSLPRTQVQEEGYFQRHEGQAGIGELKAPKGQPMRHVAQGSSKDAPQQADIVSLDMLSLDQRAAAEIRRQVLGFGFRLEFRVSGFARCNGRSKSLHATPSLFCPPPSLHLSLPPSLLYRPPSLSPRHLSARGPVLAVKLTARPMR